MEKTKTRVSDAAAQMYKNMKMGESALLDLMPKVKDEALRRDMLAHLEGYQRFAESLKTILDREHREAREANAWVKMSSKMGVAMNTMMDDTTSHIAEMIIEGATMGVTDNTRILHELETITDSDDPNYDSAKSLAKEIVSFEEKNIEAMKHYL